MTKIPVKRLPGSKPIVFRRLGVLAGKKILIVDDEPDVLETVVEVLHMCRTDIAGNFGAAHELLRTKQYDLVILDVMGVKGLHLLDIAVQQNLPAVMLTAPAMRPDYILQAFKQGAMSFIPKEDLSLLDELLAELLEISSRGDSTWPHTLSRLAPLLDKDFPPDVREEYKTLLHKVDSLAT